MKELLEKEGKMKDLHKLRKKLCNELENFCAEDELSIGTLDVVHKLTDTIKNIDKISMLEDDGYSGRYYDDGESYAPRGMHYVRGHYSRGRDSYEDGSSSRREYSRDGGKEKLYDMLRNMMDEAESERKREAYRKMIEQLGSA